MADDRPEAEKTSDNHEVSDIPAPVEKTSPGESASSTLPNDVTPAEIPQRGALLIDVAPATSVLSAGTDFSIAVRITNPFDVPIGVVSVTTKLPVDLYDVVRRREEKNREKARLQIEATRRDLLNQLGKEAVPVTRVIEGPLRRYLRGLVSILPGMAPFSEVVTDTASIAVASVADVEWSRPSWSQLTKKMAELLREPEVISEEGLSAYEILEKVEALVEPLEREYMRRYQKAPGQIELRPGDSETWVFTLRTKRGMTFRPASYKQDIAVVYHTDGVEHRQAIRYSLDIQASLKAVITGSVIGATFGVVAKKPNFLVWDLSIIAAFVSAILLSAFAVIAFARKEGVQPIVSIQDFWGGLLVGFLVGYSGVQVLGNLFGDGTVQGQ